MQSNYHFVIPIRNMRMNKLSSYLKGIYLVGGIDEAFRIANENGRIQFFK